MKSEMLLNFTNSTKHKLKESSWLILYRIDLVVANLEKYLNRLGILIYPVAD